ncbi:hypothetical protein CEXT_69041 [Caerostris extrusa]|uniref:Uncharacterized protein n=1 Tax=Caerostris extrusa TaxID=172846 RepID=A0AAV4T6M1_CAEEX|nr:hypothetical protein CEXT_69041 [Caerostris extrusa]
MYCRSPKKESNMEKNVRSLQISFKIMQGLISSFQSPVPKSITPPNTCALLILTVTAQEDRSAGGSQTSPQVMVNPSPSAFALLPPSARSRNNHNVALLFLKESSMSRNGRRRSHEQHMERCLPEQQRFPEIGWF